MSALTNIDVIQCPQTRNSEGQKEWKNSTSKLYYIEPRIKKWESAYNSFKQYEVILSRTQIGHSRLTHRHLMSKNEHQTCRNAACGDQRITIKHYLQDCPQWRDSRKKYDIQGDIRILLGKSCEVEKLMRFLKETDV